MYPYIIMKLSKKKIQKLYKSKNQTRKSGGKKSFTPKQTNHRSRKAGALNLRRRTLRKMKGGVVGENTEGKNTDNIPLVEAIPLDETSKIPVVKGVPGEEEEMNVPERGIKITKKELEEVFKDFIQARNDENRESVANTLTANDEEKGKEEQIVSFNNLSTYKEFMTKLANLILKKLTQEYDEKMEDMKKKLLKKIEGEKKPATTAESEADPADQGKAAVTGDTDDAALGGPKDKPDAALGGPEGEVPDDSNTDVNNNNVSAVDAQ